jgi:hypothetical protein
MMFSSCSWQSAGVFLLSACLCPPSALANAGALVQFSIGGVSAISAAGDSRLLSKGGRLASGDVVRTGIDGRAQLRFDDGAIVSLQPQSEFRLDDYRYPGVANGEEKGFFSLLRGGLRTITGLIGRGNLKAYKINTAVATIGVRGTEYSISYIDDDQIIVATGEGEIEVCNDIGCNLVASGESAVVSKFAKPIFTAIRPRLPPAQPIQPLLAVFSVSEARNRAGLVSVHYPSVVNPPVVNPPVVNPPVVNPPVVNPPVVNPPVVNPPVVNPPVVNPQLQSGPGYALGFAYGDGIATQGGIDATFDGNSGLLGTTNGQLAQSKAISEAMADAAGLIGWGRWQTGFLADASQIENVHYVIAKPATVADLAALGGISVVYSLVGYTLPTDQNGVVGGVPAGYLATTFSGGAISSGNLSLNVPHSGTTYILQSDNMTSSGGIFHTNLVHNFPLLAGSAKGIISSGDARYAGVVYNFESYSNQRISGSVVFKR